MKIKNNVAYYHLFATFFILLALLSFKMQSDVPRNGDITIHINAAERILAGEKLYRDMITVNFPMQFYMRIPGVLFAQAFNLDLVTVAIVFDNLMLLFSIGLTLYLLRRTVIGDHPDILWAIGLLLFYCTSIMPIIDMMIGQKEYFFWLLTIPYFTLAAARTENAEFSRRLRIFVGIVAGAGFCYKPYCVLPLLLVEGYLCWVARSPRQLIKAEFISCIAVGASYLLWMAIYFNEYWSDMVPIARFYYEMRLNFTDILRYWITRILVFVLSGIMLLAWSLCARPPKMHFLNVFCFALIGYCLEGAVQMKAFLHHFFPTFITAIMVFALAFSLARIQRQQVLAASAPAVTPRRDAPSYILGIALAGLLIKSWYLNPYAINIEAGDAFLNRVIATHQQYNPQKPMSFYKLGYRIAPMFPQGIYRGMKWDYHFYHLWLLAGITDFKTRNQDESEEWLEAKTAKAEAFMRDKVVEDMERLKPNVLLVERLGNQDLVRYFSYDPRFMELMRYFVLQDTFRGIDIYVRQDTLPTDEERKEQSEMLRLKRRQQIDPAAVDNP